MINLIMKIRSKESRLSNANRMFITNCMDAGTTSPVEAQNCVIKHGPMKVNATMDLDKAMTTIIQYQKLRLMHRQMTVEHSLKKNHFILVLNL